MDGNDIPPAVHVASIADPDLLAAALRDAQVEYLRLAPTPFTATLTAIDLGPVRVQLAADHAHIARGQVGADQSMLLTAIDVPDGGTQVNGVAVRTGDTIHLGAGAPIFARVLDPIRWAAVSFHADRLQAAMPEESLPRDGDFLHRRHGAGHAALARFVEEAGRLAARDPARLALASVRRSMGEDALRLACAVVAHPVQKDAAHRAVRRRVVLVAQAEEVLSARLGAPLYSDDLQQALGVPMRTLHNAFVAVHAMSVHRYLRLRRLHLARAALRAGNGSVSHVKIAALSHGFWHLGRFAQEYRDLFGELPSQTMAQGHSVLPGDP
ncbi:MAG TPA: helix-turn-helix domain-containing protein [Roseomonas sp.]|nr:helix-turn-helix domain-containing protein [Roseomonas sp.]